MSEKRFYIDNDGDLYDKKSNQLLMVDFGYAEAIYVNLVVELLNALHEENQELREINKWLWKKIKEIDPPQEVPITWR